MQAQFQQTMSITMMTLNMRKKLLQKSYLQAIHFLMAFLLLVARRLTIIKYGQMAMVI